ncbi:hypothetical protein HYC85_018999 [Camellia sinensis]|uniref:Uncharacterized protein n=1 Tax=Camellia sinensis TaxID=4442 RepID=A0A7J7GVV5_CAMSI|nr:hypothetical protein HYC85_018999 [Camellia sinensis]
MPSEAKKLKIGVLVETAFEMFVKVVEHSNGEKSYLGFCIEVFEKDVEVLGNDLPYKFEPFHLSYDDLVLCVGNKSVVSKLPRNRIARNQILSILGARARREESRNIKQTPNGGRTRPHAPLEVGA